MTTDPVHDSIPTAPPARPATRSDSPASRIRVEPWVDAVVDNLGVDPRSRYVEQFWLPVVGPTTVMLCRGIAERFEESPDGFQIDARHFASDLGVGSGSSKSPNVFRKTLERAARFGLVRLHGDDLVLARRKLPPLNGGQVNRLRPEKQRQHREWQRRQLERAKHPATIGHATRLAESLMLVGAGDADVREQLALWRFDATTIDAAVRAAHRRLESGLGQARSA